MSFVNRAWTHSSRNHYNTIPLHKEYTSYRYSLLVSIFNNIAMSSIQYIIILCCTCRQSHHGWSFDNTSNIESFLQVSWHITCYSIFEPFGRHSSRVQEDSFETDTSTRSNSVIFWAFLSSCSFLILGISYAALTNRKTSSPRTSSSLTQEHISMAMEPNCWMLMLNMAFKQRIYIVNGERKHNNPIKTNTLIGRNI